MLLVGNRVQVKCPESAFDGRSGIIIRNGGSGYIVLIGQEYEVWFSERELVLHEVIIEANKTYRTKNNQKIQIQPDRYDGEVFLWRGKVLTLSAKGMGINLTVESIYGWTHDGKFCPNEISEYDLVSEVYENALPCDCNKCKEI